MFNGFFGIKDNPETLYLTYATWLVTMVLFIIAMCGSISTPMRFFYFAKCGEISFGYVGICTQNGAECSGSLVKPALEVAYQLSSQQSTMEEFKSLQNDISFFLPSLSLFSFFVAGFWVTVQDRDEKNETVSYLLWPCLIAWSGVGFAWTAAWNATFTTSVIVDSQTGCSRGILMQGFLWTIFLLTMLGGIFIIRYAFDTLRTAVLGARAMWKAKYLNLVTPKDKVIQEVYTPHQRVDGSTQRVLSDALA